MTLKDFAGQNGINYRTAQTWLRRGRIQRTDSGFTLVEDSARDSRIKDSAEDSRLRRREDSISPLNPESYPESLNPESCAGCEALKRKIESLRDRVAALESAPDRAATLTSQRPRSNYAGSQARHGVAFDDCVTPYEGDYPQ